MSASSSTRGGLDFIVRREDLRECKVVPAPGPDEIELQPGELILDVDRFAFTSNNITYAAFGDAMQYWSFFPAPEGWGRIPVWGFGDVIRSMHDSIAEGERVFGYLPMSTHLLLQPDQVGEAGFVDASPHRAVLPGAYQQYRRVGNDPDHDPGFEDHLALLQPLFMTSFLIADFLADAELFGARRVLLSSASSKTALGLAFLLSRNRPSGCEVVGLTSPRNVTFCESIGCYDEVVAYGDLESVSRDTPTVFVDMAGDGKLLAAVHRHFQGNLEHSCLVGATHWEHRGAPEGLPGPDPQFFFAPTQIEKRMRDWGAEGFGKRYGDARQAFVPSTRSWMNVVHGSGPAAVEAVYRNMLEGKVDPSVGQMLSLDDGGQAV
jgi:uncharacterized protein DUF2855